MREVVFDAVNFETAVVQFRAAGVGELLGDAARVNAAREMREHVRGGLQRVGGDVRNFRGHVRAVIVTESDVFNVFDFGSGHLQHGTNGLARKTGDVFDALSETFFADGRNQFPVAHEARGGIRVEGVQAENQCHC